MLKCLNFEADSIFASLCFLGCVGSLRLLSTYKVHPTAAASASMVGVEDVTAVLLLSRFHGVMLESMSPRATVVGRGVRKTSSPAFTLMWSALNADVWEVTFNHVILLVPHAGADRGVRNLCRRYVRLRSTGCRR